MADECSNYYVLLLAWNLLQATVLQTSLSSLPRLATWPLMYTLLGHEAALFPSWARFCLRDDVWTVLVARHIRFTVSANPLSTSRLHVPRLRATPSIGSCRSCHRRKWPPARYLYKTYRVHSYLSSHHCNLASPVSSASTDPRNFLYLHPFLAAALFQL